MGSAWALVATYKCCRASKDLGVESVLLPKSK